MRARFLTWVSALWATGVLFCCAGCGPSSSSPTGFDWPRWRGPRGDGVSLESGWDPIALEGGPRVLWEVDIGAGYSCVSVKGSRVFAFGCTGTKNTLSCLDAATGRTLWRYSIPSSEDPQSTPAVDEDSAYALTNKGILACVDARNGRLRWQKHLAQEYDALDPYYGFSTSPVIDGDLVILNANASGMAVDKRTGRLAWTSEKPPAQRLIAELGTDNGVTYMSPALFEQGDRRLALVSSWQGLFAVDVKTGQPAWRYPWQNYNINKTPDPVVVGSRVLLVDDSRIGRGARFSTLLDVSGHEPRVAWESEALYSDVCTPVVLDGYAYCEHGGCYPNSPTSSLRCIELATGRLAWEHFPQGRKSKEWISLVIADGKLIVLTASGRLQVAEASPQGWRPIAGCQLPKGNKRLMRYWTVPVLSHGRIYCRGYDGSLACIDVRP